MHVHLWYCCILSEDKRRKKQTFFINRTTVGVSTQRLKISLWRMIHPLRNSVKLSVFHSNKDVLISLLWCMCVSYVFCFTTCTEIWEGIWDLKLILDAITKLRGGNLNFKPWSLHNSLMLPGGNNTNFVLQTVQDTIKMSLPVSVCVRNRRKERGGCGSQG